MCWNNISFFGTPLTEIKWMDLSVMHEGYKHIVGVFGVALDYDTTVERETDAFIKLHLT